MNTKDWAGWLKLDLHDDAEIVTLVERCAEFALAMKAEAHPRWITILGNSGTGKTHCARRLWKMLEHKCGYSPDFNYNPSEIYWPLLVSQMRGGDYSQYHDAIRWRGLFLDDIGAERDPNGFAAEQLNTLLGCRENKWTILTSNLTLGQIGKIDPRMADRIIRRPNIFIEVNTKSHSLR